ncbi:MAG: hypothetical protein J1F07_08330 [Muribaculaceae bacterium]|nr:hypothetical protein [Muribaculaceae bacterium]
MKAKVYLIGESWLISMIEDKDIQGFRDYVENEEFPLFEEPIEFDTEKEAQRFCASLYVEGSEGFPTEVLPLRSYEKYDQPYIEAIESI